MSRELIIGIALIAILVIYYLYTSKNKKKVSVPEKPKKKNSTRMWVIIVVSVVVCLSGYAVYSNNSEKYTSISIGEAITLSKSSTFNKLEIESTSSISTSSYY